MFRDENIILSNYFSITNYQRLMINYQLFKEFTKCLLQPIKF
jgi:hypothetical protein